MGITHTPVTIRTPVKATVDITAVETLIMDLLAPVVTELIQKHVDFDANTPELCDCDPGFEITGTAIQEGTLIHIDAFDLNPPEDSVEPDDIPVDASMLQKELGKHIIERMSGEEWKRRIANAVTVKLTVDKSDRALDRIDY